MRVRDLARENGLRATIPTTSRACAPLGAASPALTSNSRAWTSASFFLNGRGVIDAFSTMQLVYRNTVIPHDKITIRHLWAGHITGGIDDEIVTYILSI